jgi:hypothetical protein
MSNRNNCERCGEELHPDREVYLELDQRTRTYAKEGTVPPEHSQGGFPFGAACAQKELQKHERAQDEIERKLERQPCTETNYQLVDGRCPSCGGAHI